MYRNINCTIVTAFTNNCIIKNCIIKDNQGDSIIAYCNYNVLIKNIKSYDYLEVSTGFFETIKLLRSLLDNDNYKREFIFLINFLMERLSNVIDKDMSETFFKQIQFLLNNESIISIFINEIILTKNKDLVKKLLYYISRKNKDEVINSHYIIH